MADLADGPGERFGHRHLLARARELRIYVRSAEALYVALSEALAAPLLTMDHRLGRVRQLRCDVEVLR